MVKQLMESKHWGQYKKDVKGIKIGFFAIVLASSFQLSMAFLHTYQGIKNPKLYVFAISAFVLAFTYKEVCFYFTNNKYKRLLKQGK